MIPVRHGGRWPHFAMLIEGLDVAVPLSDRGVHQWRVPLRAFGEGTLDDTARLSHITDWDDEESGGEMGYGAPDALAAIRNRDIPGGFTIEEVERLDDVPDEPQWRQPYEPEEFRHVDDRLLIQEADFDGDYTLTRVLLKHDDALRTAFTLRQRGELGEYNFHEGVVMRVDGKLLVIFTVQGYEQYFSWHDAETGERIGEPHAVGTDGLDTHGGPALITAVVHEGEIMGHAVGGLVFEGLGERGRNTPICEESPPPPPHPDPMDDDYEQPPFLPATVARLRTIRGVRCLLEERFD